MSPTLTPTNPTCSLKAFASATSYSSPAKPGTATTARSWEAGSARRGEQAFSNLDRALKAGGSSLGCVAKVTIFVTDMGNFGTVPELRRKFFSPPYPADSIVEVTALYTPDAMIEIEAMAAVVTRQDIQR